jgi:hypothetical protein
MTDQPLRKLSELEALLVAEGDHTLNWREIAMLYQSAYDRGKSDGYLGRVSHDPVDMPHIEPPSEASTVLALITDLIGQAQADLRKPAEQSSNLSSWKIEHHSQRAQALAQIASANAQYTIALLLERLTELLEEGLPQISQNIDKISDAIELVPGAMP